MFTIEQITRALAAIRRSKAPMKKLPIVLSLVTKMAARLGIRGPK